MFKSVLKKTVIKKIALALFVLLLLLPVALSTGCSQDDPWTDDTYLQNLYVWDGATWNQITTNGGGGGGIGDVTAAANMVDHTLIRGDGGAKGVQDSGIIIDDTDNIDTNGGDIDTNGGDLWVQTVTAHGDLNTDQDVNAGNDVNVTNDLDVTDDAGVGGNLTVTGSITSGGSAVILEGDARLTDARNPLAHSASHESGGSDQVHSIADNDDDTKIQVEEAADEDKIRFDTGGTERSVLDSTGLTAPHSIADNYVLTVDQADAADNDFAKFTANGLEGRSYSETLSDIGAESETHAADHAVSAADTVFPADPDADRYLMWDDNPGVLAWVAAVGGDVSTDAIWDSAGDLATGTGANTAAVVNIGAEEVVARIGIANIDGISMAEQTVLARLTGASINDVAIGIADNNMLQVDDATAVDNDYAKFTANGIEGVSYATVLSDIGAAAAADYIAEALMDADTVLTATNDNTPLATTMAEQTVLGRLTGGHPDDIAIGIADNNMVQIDQLDAADDEYARFTANGLESRSYAEVKSDLGLGSMAYETATNYIAKALMDADTVITATADDTPLATTMAEQTVLGRLTGGHLDDIAIGITDDDILQADDATIADNDYAKFTANGVEGVTAGTVLSDIGAADTSHAGTHESGGSDQVSNIADDDDDTKIQVEESADEDIIRLDTGGTERITVSSSGVDFEQYKAIAMTCDNGATLPAAPVAGQWFLHTPTGRKILYQYDGSSWITSSIISLGTMYLWVDASLGTPTDPNYGYALGAGAFTTISYAISIIPPIFNGNVFIFVSGEAYAETVTIQGKTPGGNYSIYIYGALSTLQSGTADAGTAADTNVVGSGAAYGILYDVDAFGTDRSNKLLLAATGAVTSSAITSKAAYQLINSGATFTTSDIGKIVVNTTADPDTYAVVTAFIDSHTLLLNADIFPVAGGLDNYSIYVTDTRVIDNICHILTYTAGSKAVQPVAGMIVKGAGGRGVIVSVAVDGGTSWAAGTATGTMVIVRQNATAFAAEACNIYTYSDNSASIGTFTCSGAGTADDDRLAIVNIFTLTTASCPYIVCDWATSVTEIDVAGGQIGIVHNYISLTGGATYSAYLYTGSFTSYYYCSILKYMRTQGTTYYYGCLNYVTATMSLYVTFSSASAVLAYSKLVNTNGYTLRLNSSSFCQISFGTIIQGTTRVISCEGAYMMLYSSAGYLRVRGATVGCYSLLNGIFSDYSATTTQFVGNTSDFYWPVGGSDTESVVLKERAAAPTAAATYGYSWWKNTTPNEPWITDDAGTSTTFPFVYSQSLANDASITLRTGRAGFGTVIFGDNVERGEFYFTSAGVVTLGDVSANVVNTDTVNKYCIIDAGSGPAIKNRSGGVLTVTAMVVYQ